MSIGPTIDIDRLSSRIRRIGWAVFGDRIGATLFIGACLFFGLLWQVGFFINDTWTIANNLIGVANGHLYIDRVVYGSYLQTPGVSPGTHVVGQRVYGRNYGQLFLAVPFFWAMQLLSLLADPRILMAALWSLGLVLFGHEIGILIGRYRESLLGACLLALGLFGVNVWLAVPLDPRWIPHLSLQLSTIVVAGMAVVVLYRLLQLIADRRTATTLATAAAVSTPIAFWATLPKRHSLSALFVLLTVYFFARSRSADDARTGRRFRALAYAPVALLAWVHAAEGLTTFVALIVVDFATTRSNRLRDLATVAGVFLVSLLPFMLTNAAVTGDPMLPPRLWSGFEGTEPVFIDGEAFNLPESAADPSTPESDAGPSTPGSDVAPVTPIGDTGRGPSLGVSDFIGLASSAWTDSVGGIQYLRNEFERSYGLLTTNPGRFSQSFIRGGWAPYQVKDKQAINLSFLEAAPWFGVVIAIPVFARRLLPQWPRDWTSQRQIDLLVAAIAIGFLLFNLQRIPVHVSGTVRYLHPLVPLSVYAVARLDPIQKICREQLRTVSWSFTGGFLIGGQLLVVALAILPSTFGGAIQLQALVNLAFATLLFLWAVATAVGLDFQPIQTVGAVLVGLAIASGTVTMFFLVTNHLAYGDAVLGIGRVIRFLLPP